MYNKDVYLGFGGRQRDVHISVSSSGQGSRDYNVLLNKPQINYVTLEGNLFLLDLFPDGILINCGNATGYPTPIIPQSVSQEEGG